MVSLDRHDDPRRANPGTSASLSYRLHRRCLEDVEARLVVGQERRADVADGDSLTYELLGGVSGAASRGTGFLCSCARDVRLDEIA